MVGEVLKLAPSFARGVRACGLELLHIDVEAGDGTPEVLPPGGQHAGLHHLPGLHEGHDVVDEAIRQGAQRSPPVKLLLLARGRFPFAPISMECPAWNTSSAEGQN